MTKEKQGILTKTEIRSKSPKIRDQYANNLILEFFDRNPNNDVTISEIVSKTQLSRITIMKHLERLVALRKIRKRDFGHIAIYSKGGHFDEKTSESYESSNGISYGFQVVNRGANGNFIYIQEKQIGDLREEKVTGGIMVNVQDAQKFIKMLHTFAMKEMELESGK